MDTFNHREHISLALNMSSETNNLSVYDLTAASHEGDSIFEEGLTPIGESFDGGPDLQKWISRSCNQLL